MKYRFFSNDLYRTTNYTVNLVIPFNGKSYFQIYDNNGETCASYHTFEECLNWLDLRGELPPNAPFDAEEWESASMS